MKFLSVILYILLAVGCTNEGAKLTANTNSADVYSTLLDSLVSNGGFTPVLTGEQKGTGKDDLVLVTVNFDTHVEEFNEEDIEVTNAYISGLKQTGFGEYQFFLQPILPEEVTVYIPKGNVSHGIFAFDNLESNKLTYTFSDPEYDELKKNGLQVVLTSSKNGGIMNVVATFNSRLKDFTESDLNIENGAITKFKKISDTVWEIEITALKAGNVTAFVPADSVKSKFYGYKNKESNTVKESFEDYEIDQTIKVDSILIGKKEDYKPAKLVLVIDDSSSMAQVQAKVANAIKESLSKLKGKNVRVYAYSTSTVNAGHGNFGKTYKTQMPYGQTVYGSYTGSIPSVSNGFKTFGQYLNYYRYGNSSAPFLYKDVFVKKNNVETKFTEGMFFDHDEVVEKFSINKSAFDSNDGSVFLSANLSDSEFDESIEKIYSRVNAFGTKGSTREMPLCTLMALLKNEGPHAIFNTKEKTTFLVITDENHHDKPCISGHHSEHRKLEGFTAYAENQYRYLYFYNSYVCDNGSDKICVRRSGLRMPKESDCLVDGYNVCSSEKRACNAEEIKLVRDKYKDSTTVILGDTDETLRCEIEVRNSGLAYTGSFGSKGVLIKTKDNVLGELQTSCDDIKNFEVYTLSDPTDPKSLKVWKTENSKSLLQYIKDYNKSYYEGTDVELGYTGRCSYRPYNTYQKLLGEDAGPANAPNGKPDGRKDGYTYFNGITNLEDLKDSISDTAKELFGESNYTIVGIANLGEKNPEGCPNTLAAKSTDIIDISDTSISICEENYDKALAWFDKFLKFVPEPTYDLKDPALNLQDSVKNILSIKLDYQESSLDKSEYEFKDGILTFKNPDILRFIGGEMFEIKYRNVAE